jgi:antitoxin CptB
MQAVRDGPEIGSAPGCYFADSFMMATEEALDLRRRRLRFRAWHRGIRETDLILGKFADVNAGGFTAEEVADFERLLDLPDRDILDWVTGAAAVPEEQYSPLLARILAFHGTR